MLQFDDQLHLPLKLLDEGFRFGKRGGEGFDRNLALRGWLEAFVDCVLALMIEFDELILADGFAL